MTAVEAGGRSVAPVLEVPEEQLRHARVSCIIIFLDGAAFIDEAIRSVVDQQGFDDWELFLVDDGSTDASTGTARAWAARDPRITYLEHDGHANQGMSASRNLGLTHAKGEMVAFLDCDDVWLPTKLATQVALLDAHPEVDATYGPTRVWHSWTGDPADATRDRLAPVGVERDTVFEPPSLMVNFRRARGANVPAICSILVRRRAVTVVGGFDDRFRGSFEDQVFYVKMGLHMTVLVTRECLDLYRQHPDSHCAQGIAERSYHPVLLNPTEERYLRWLSSYLESIGMQEGEIWEDVQESLEAYRPRFHPVLLRNERWRRSTRGELLFLVRRHLPTPIRRPLGRLLRRARGIAVPALPVRGGGGREAS